MADNTITLQITKQGSNRGDSVTYGSFEVQKPQNYTNNAAFIGQHPLTTQPEEAISKQAEWTHNNSGKLMSCFEINWGGATESWKNTDGTGDPSSWNDTDYYFPSNIETSSDLLRYIFMLRYEIYKLQHPAANITLNAVADNSSIAYNGSTIIRASLSNDYSASGTIWSIKSGDSYGSLSATTGELVTLTGNNTATGGTTNNPGTITSNNPVLSSIEYNGNTTVSVSASNGSTVIANGTNQIVTVTATNTSATAGYQTKDVNITVQGKPGNSTNSQVRSYKWTITSGNNYASLKDDTTPTVTVKGNNTTTSDQTVIVQCKVTWDNGATKNSITKSIKVKKKPTPSTTYYWYVGTTNPTDPTDTAQNTGNNKWTSLGTNLPTSDIKVNKVDKSYNLSTWYIAAPSEANFTLFNGTNVASNEAAWSKSTFNVGSVKYTLWTSKGQSYQAVGYLHINKF